MEHDQHNAIVNIIWGIANEAFLCPDTKAKARKVFPDLPHMATELNEAVAI